MSTEQQWLDSLTDADKDQLLVDAYFKKSIADTAGAKTVPHEPTKEMLEAGREQLNRMGFVKDVWQAMYCAAPETGEKNAFREGFKNALRFPPLGYAAPPAPSVADLESVQQEYYKRGFNEGRAIGRTEAPSVADAAGAKSMVEFYKAARNDGYAEGYTAGVEFMRKNK